MKIVLFCEQRYEISILQPIQDEALRQGEHELLWYVNEKNIPDFIANDGIPFTGSMQELYNFNPEVVFVPSGMVPFYLPGVKVHIFDGYAMEKKEYRAVCRYFDMYLTQGPFFTQRFQQLAEQFGGFDVVETGWPRQDWIFRNQHTFDEEKAHLLANHGKSKMVLYAPTCSSSHTSLGHMALPLSKLAATEDVLILLKFHPHTDLQFVDQYKQLADQTPNILWVEDDDISKYELMADVMISDTSSVMYEFLLLNKPVITFRTVAKDIYWIDIDHQDELCGAYSQSLTSAEYAQKRKWIIDNYDPYFDGKVALRMLSAVEEYIAAHGVPTARKLNLWHQYECYKKFGRIETK
ncbi:MAG: CDP-glycerol glycerophosphotransferase family protein [Marinifilaceae bacterium]